MQSIPSRRIKIALLGRPSLSAYWETADRERALYRPEEGQAASEPPVLPGMADFLTHCRFSQNWVVSFGEGNSGAIDSGWEQPNSELT